MLSSYSFTCVDNLYGICQKTLFSKRILHLDVLSSASECSFEPQVAAEDN